MHPRCAPFSAFDATHSELERGALGSLRRESSDGVTSWSPVWPSSDALLPVSVDDEPAEWTDEGRLRSGAGMSGVDWTPDGLVAAYQTDEGVDESR